MSNLELLKDEQGKKVLAKDLQKVYQLMQGEDLAINAPKGEVVKFTELLAKPVKETLETFWRDRRGLNPENYASVVGLAELVQHIKTKHYLVKGGKQTQLMITGRHAQIKCREIYEQFGTKCTAGDLIKLATENGSCLAKFEYENAQTRTLLLEIRKSSERGQLQGKLVSLTNIQRDGQIHALLTKIKKFSGDLIRYLFPDGKKWVEEQVKRQSWVIDETDLKGKHLKFVQWLTKLRFGQPFVLQGCYGSGKSHALASLVKAYILNHPKCKIVIGSANNGAVDSLLLKILDKVPKAKVLRYTAQRHTATLPAKLATERVLCADLKEAINRFARGAQVLGATVCKYSTQEEVSEIKADLIILDEAASTTELSAALILHGFADLSKTNLVLAGDVYQMPGLVWSEESRALNHEISIMKRLMSGDRTYRKQNQGAFPTILDLNESYRCPEPVTRILSDYYPDGVEPAPDPARARKYLNLPNLPKGHIIFHNVEGAKKSTYSNGQGSMANEIEANWITDYCRILVRQNGIPKKEILIISYYNKQKFMIKEKLAICGLPHTETEDEDAILILSPTCSQGLERPIVIISTVQTGFQVLGDHLRDDQQNLVALSRCSSLLIVLGNAGLLNQHPKWRPILKYTLRNQDIGRKFLSLGAQWTRKYEESSSQSKVTT